MEENKNVDVKLGDIVLRYNEEGQGQLAMDFYLDIDVTEEDVMKLQVALTEMNNVIVPLINKKLDEEEE